MYYYFIFTLLVSWLYFFNKSTGYYLLLLAIPIFLYNLPPTLTDYYYYKLSYDNALFYNKFPYFISHSILTAEPLYVWYTSVISVLTNASFAFYLAFNFIICVLILNIALNSTNRNIKKYFYLFLLPVIIPTIFYFSPRSSISFCFIFLGFLKLCKDNKLTGILYLFIGMLFHSQFILVTFYILLLYYLSNKPMFLNSKKAIIQTNISLAIVLFVFLFSFNNLVGYISKILEFLPTAEIATTKLNYFSSEEESSSFRLTSILSILIYPLISIYFMLFTDIIKKTNRNFLFCIIGIVMFGASVNLAFINEAHIAGRLSRFSDYFCMAFLIPYLFYTYKQHLFLKVIALVFCIITPVIFKSLYSGSTGLI